MCPSSSTTIHSPRSTSSWCRRLDCSATGVSASWSLTALPDLGAGATAVMLIGETIAERLSSMAETLDVPVVVLSRLNLRASTQQSPIFSDDVRDVDSMERFHDFILVSQASSAPSDPSALTIRLNIEDPVRKPEPVIVKWVGFEPTGALGCDLPAAERTLD